MTIGIYKLVFENTNKIYIGKSIHINRRRTEHIRSLRAGISPKKLQQAYYLYGEPNLELIEEVSISDIDIKEEEYILLYNSIKEGFNTLPGGRNSFNYKTYSSISIYPEDIYKEILWYLVNTNIPISEIVSITETTTSIVNNLACLNTHSWLEEECPEEYAVLKFIHKNGGRRGYLNTKDTLPTIVSPTGTIYTISNLTSFSKEHSLDRSSIWCLLNNRCSTYNGWHLETTSIPINNDIVSPEGVSFTIPYRGIRSFAREYGLNQSDLTKLLTGKLKSHKGWKLVEPSEK